MKTILQDGQRYIVHDGTSGLTITGILDEDGQGIETLIEWSEIKTDELRGMVGTLLCLLDEMLGEPFVTSCFAHYAREMGKHEFSDGAGHTFTLLRSEKT